MQVCAKRPHPDEIWRTVRWPSFEAALVEIARFIGVPTVQGPGRVSLFGTPAASKLRHELDLAMIAPGMLGIAEAKDRSDGVGKTMS